jgi:hypothetical protein
VTKVPAVIFGFWIIKIAATTLGALHLDLRVACCSVLDRVRPHKAAWRSDRAISSTSPLPRAHSISAWPLASAVPAVFIVACILILPQRPGTHPGTSTEPV